MTITEIFDGREWIIIFENDNHKKQFGADEFPFTAKQITGRDADKIINRGPTGNPIHEVWIVV